MAVGLLLGVLYVLVFDGIEISIGETDALSEAVSEIEESYWKPADVAKLEDIGAQGMVDYLRKRYDDRFSHYFDPKTYDEFQSSTRGQFSGVGLAVSEVKQGLRVAQVYPDTPAAETGIEEGDVIVESDGESLAGLGAAAAAAKIKGRPGTMVVLTVKSGDSPARELELRRAEVRIPAVRGEIREAGGRPIAYVQLATFSEGASEELRQQIEKLDRRGAEGLVLDLRGNGGGLLNEAVLTSSVFVEDGVIVATEGRTQERQEYRALGDALPARPTAILVDRDTASAAEILAAALADHGLAELVGARTYGKGTFQEVIGLENGGALDLTVGEFVTSEGESLAGKGIKPDVRVPDDGDPQPDEALREALDLVAGEL